MKKVYKIITILTGSLLIVAVVVALFVRFPVRGSLYQDNVQSFSDGWYDRESQRINLETYAFDAEKQTILHIPVESQNLNSRSLCFSSSNIRFSIYLGSRLIYEFEPDLSGLYGKYYGDYLHTVQIPAFYGNTDLSIRCVALLENDWTGFHDVTLSDSGTHVLTLFRENIVNFLICFVSFGFGVVLFLFGLVLRKVQHNPIETVSLGVITMTLSIWANSQNEVLVLLTGNSASIHILDYLALMILPVPVLIFMNAITENQHDKCIFCLVLLSCINIIVQFTAVMLHISDYHNMLKISHILILVDSIIIIGVLLSARRKEQTEKKQQMSLVTGFGIVVTGGILDMARYYLFHAKDSSLLSRIGLMIFILILSSYEFQNVIAIHVRSSEVEMMHTLATEDALTGMKNRTAFNEYEKEMLNRTKGFCLFVHLDVNHLKKVNDTYGHAEGDKHIKAAADVIQHSFGEKGNCFRVGGDEFFAVLDSETCYFDYETAAKKFYQLQEEYNQTEQPHVPLAIAHGVAEYHYSMKNPDEAEKIADNRMYENKRQMKSVRMRVSEIL